MDKAISALKYSAHCSLPYAMVKQYCADGIIPCFRYNNRYRIRVSIADEALAKYEAQKIETPTKKEVPNILKQPKNFDFLEALKQA